MVDIWVISSVRLISILIKLILAVFFIYIFKIYSSEILIMKYT